MNEDEICFIFDLDGTLLDDISLIIDFFGKIIPQKFGKSLSPEKIEEMKNNVSRMIQGKSSKLLVLKMLWKFGDELDLNLSQKLKMLKIINIEYKKLLKDLPFFPGTIDALNSLHQRKFHLALNTSSSNDELDMKFEQYPDVRALFGDRVITRSVVENLKPAPDGIISIAQKIGITTEQCVMIGDMQVDIEAAKNAMAVSVVVLGGFLSEQDLINLNLSPDFVFQSVVDMIDHLDQIIAFIEKNKIK